MKYSRKDLIERTLQNKDVDKTVEAIIRTPARSDARELAVKAFQFKFGQIATEMFKENVGCTYGDDILLEAKVSPSGWLELLNVEGLNDKILKILLKEECVNFEIGTTEELYLTVNQFLIEGNKTTLHLSVYLTGDEKVDKRINSIITSLRKR